MKTQIHTLLFFIALIFFSCENTPTISRELVIETKEMAVRGTVRNADGKPLAEVLVLSGSETAMTDENGIYAFIKIESVNNRSVLKFSKKGYFSLTRSVELNGNENFDAVLHLEGNSDVSLQNTFSANEDITLPVGKMNVHIPANSLVDSLGKAYAGLVSADVLYLSPENPDFTFMMPGGDMAAVRTNGEEVILLSYGMVKVELKTENGEKLQLKKGAKSTLTFPIPSGMKAVDTLPLWHFNETEGLWEEEGFALKKDNEYVGQVSHFSWWNIDYPSTRVEIRGKITDCKDEPVTEGKIYVVIDSTTQLAFNILPNGTYRLFAPANMPFSFNVNRDNSIFFSIEAYRGNTVLGKDIKIPCLTDEKGKPRNNTDNNKPSYSYIKVVSGVPVEYNYNTAQKDTFIIDTLYNSTYQTWEVQEKPSFPGGEAALYKYIGNTLRYPAQMAANNVQGKVYVEFIISKTGKITNARILKTLVTPDGDKEVIRIIEAMPDWTPGKQNGEPVNVRYQLPINFKIQ